MTSLSIDPSVHCVTSPSMYMSIHHISSLSVDTSRHHTSSPSVNPSICPVTSLSTNSSVHHVSSPSIDPSIHHAPSPSDHLSTSDCLYEIMTHLSACLSSVMTQCLHNSSQSLAVMNGSNPARQSNSVGPLLSMTYLQVI